MKADKSVRKPARSTPDPLAVACVASGKPRLSFLRREPTQARGMESVIEILNACESLLGEMQADDIVVDQIAKRARVQVGSVYFFFKDRLHIYFSLIEMTLRQIGDEYNAMQGAAMDLSLPAFMRELEQRLTRLWLQHRTMLDLFFSYRAHPKIKPIVMEVGERASETVTRKVAMEFPKLSPERHRSLARLIHHHLVLGLDAEPELPRAAIGQFRDDWRAMMTAYLTQFDAQR